jgi:hypothetical protein
MIAHLGSRPAHGHPLIQEGKYPLFHLVYKEASSLLQEF